MGTPDETEFERLLDRAATKIRRRLRLRAGLTGAVAGMALAAIGAGVSARFTERPLRVAFATAALVGVGASLVYERRRRWTRLDVALYLDDRLSTGEVIASASTNDGANGAMHGVVVSRALESLRAARDASPAPGVFQKHHGWLPVALAAHVAFVCLPSPTRAQVEPTSAPGLEARDTKTLDAARAVATLPARDEAQRERLARAAENAEKLKEELRRGLERRQALDRLAELREALVSERLPLDASEERSGRESAIARLAETSATRRSARALGDHDFATMDAEMERLANQRELRDREEARRALSEAAKAARAQGASKVADTLDAERSLLEDRAQKAARLRELAQALAEDGEASPLTRKLERLDREGSASARAALAEALADALESLSPEERARLAQRLREAGRRGAASPQDAKRLEDLAKELATPEGRRELERRLRELAKEKSTTEEGERERGLDEAIDGVDETGSSLGGVPVPSQGGPSAGPGQGEDGSGQASAANPAHGGKTAGDESGRGGGPGSGPGGQADHTGQTQPVEGTTLKSRTRGPLAGGEPMPGSVPVFAPGQAGGLARTPTTEALRVRGTGEVEGVEQSDVPEEYKEHVREYFQP